MKIETEKLVKVFLVIIAVVFVSIVMGVAKYLISKEKTDLVNSIENSVTIRNINFVKICLERKDEFFNFCDSYQIGGKNNPVTYQDLTGDNKEEAVISLGSGGSAGNIGIAVFKYENDTLSQLLFSNDNDFKIETSQLITIRQVLLSLDNNQRSDAQYTYYVYNKGKNVLEIQKIEPVINTGDWKTYRNEKYEFEYPAIISLKQDGENITLSHSIAYKHDNPCDFKGDAPALEKLLDFNVFLTTFSGSLKNAIQSNEGSDYVVKNFFENNTLKLATGFIDSFTAGSLTGFEVASGAEGCGRTAYYFPISSTETLIVNRSLITELILNSEAYLDLPGIISPNQENEFFTKILSTFKFTENNETADWKTYKDDNYKFSFKYPASVVVNPSKSNNNVNYYMILIDKSENVSAEGFEIGDVSTAFIQINNNFSGDVGSQVTINSPLGKITATYITDRVMGYTYYAYEFQREGKHYLFRMNNYDNKPVFMSASQFKVMVDTISWN